MSAIAAARKRAEAAARAALPPRPSPAKGGQPTPPPGTPRGRPSSSASAAPPSGARAAFPSYGGDNGDDTAADDDASHAPERDEVFLAFLHEGATAGVAYYSTAEGAIATTSVHCPEDDLGWIIGVVKQQVAAPSMVVTTSRVSEAARRELGRGVLGGAAGDGSGDVLLDDVVPVKVVKHATFALELATSLLAAVVGGGGGGGGSGAQALGSFVDTGDAAALRAAGGLLHWLLKSGIISELDAEGGGGGGGGGGALPGGLRMFSLGEMMQADAASLAALSVFAREAHPSALGGGGAAGGGGGSRGAKEGFSLCALLDRTVCAPGKRMLRTWCLQPSLDAEVLRHRHDAVGFLMAARVQAPELWRELRGYLKRVKDLGRLLGRVRGAKAGPSDWFGLAQTVLAANMVRDHLHLLLTHVKAADVTSLAPAPLASTPRGAGAGSSSAAAAATAPSADPLAPSTPYSVAAPFLLRQIVTVEFGPDLTLLQTTLDAVIDWEASRESGSGGGGARLAVRAGLDAQLDAYRRTYADLPAFLSEVSASELEKYPTLASLRMKYLPQIGVVVEVDKADNGLAPGTADVAAAAASSSSSVAGGLVSVVDSDRAAAVIPPDFVLAYETAGELLFKSPKAVELDEYFGDVAGVVGDLEASIVRQLEGKLLEYEGLLATVGQRLAELDVLASFAEVAQDYRYVRPRLVDEPVLLVKGARHPLQELTVDTFVPNDVAIGPGRPDMGGSLSIVTGPNFSGKSVYLKTVGLIPYMAQVGCYVPAERAVLGLVDRIFTRVASPESAAAGGAGGGASAFSIDLHQVGLMLRHATPRSLLLIDEFGKGTSSIDGVALLAATIRTLLQGAPVPSPMPAAGGGGASSSSSARRLPPKTVVTTHFREVFDFDLLGLGGGDDKKDDSASAADTAGCGSGGDAAASLAAGSNAVDDDYDALFADGGDDGMTPQRAARPTTAAVVTPRVSPSSSGAGSASTLPPLPASARREVSFYQMRVVLRKEDRAAVLAGRAATATSTLRGAADGGDGGSQADDADAATAAGGDAGEDDDDDYTGSVVPLFQLVQGRATSSYGLDCAARGGIPRHVVDRARAVTAALTSTGTVAPLPEAPHRAAATAAREAAQLALAGVLLSVPDWAAASPDQLVAALRAVRAAVTTA